MVSLRHPPVQFFKYHILELSVRLWCEGFGMSFSCFRLSLLCFPSYKDWTITFTVLTSLCLFSSDFWEWLEITFCLCCFHFLFLVARSQPLGAYDAGFPREPLSLFISGISRSLLGLVLKIKLGLKTLHFKVDIESWSTKLCTLTICKKQLSFSQHFYLTLKAGM